MQISIFDNLEQDLTSKYGQSKIFTIKSVKNWSLMTGYLKITTFNSVRRNPRSITSLNHVRSSILNSCSALNFQQFDIYIDHIWRIFWMSVHSNGQEFFHIPGRCYEPAAKELNIKNEILDKKQNAHRKGQP